MNNPQHFFLLVYFFISVCACIHGIYQCIKKRNVYGKTPFYYILGSFVWVDAVIFGIFWTFVTTIVLLSNNWFLFLLIISLFWIVRSIGEILYWIHEQFASNHRNKPKDLLLSRFFDGDSIWVVYQLFWQCFLVINLVCLFFVLKSS